MTVAQPTARIAPGSDGAGRARRLYRRSIIRRLHKVNLSHRGLGARDVFIASYPRSGNLWLRYMLYELVCGDASFAAIIRDVPYVGGQRQARRLLPDGGRLMKTHEPYLRYYRRAIHLVRDPRDMAISYFTFMQRIEKIRLRPGDDADASFDHFLDALLAGRVDAYGTWQGHLDSWLAAAEHGRCDILRVRYEDLRADPVTGVIDIAAWLGVGADRERAARAVEASSLDKMRAVEQAELSNSTVLGAGARRTGISLLPAGGVERWRTQMTAEQQARFAAFADGLAALGYPPAAQPAGTK